MRRLAFETEPARSAVWARRLAIAGAALAVIAVAWAQRPLAQPGPPVAILIVALAIACLCLQSAAKATRTIWRTGQAGAARVLLAMVLAGLTLAYPVFLLVRAIEQPFVAEASTDPVDPPQFSRASKAFAVRRCVPGLPETKTRRAVEDAAVIDVSATEAYGIVQKALAALRWHVVDAIPPGGRLGLGHVDAVSYSSVMRLPQDLAVRITPLAGRARIDIRSVARLGIYDFGESLGTIRRLKAALEEETPD